MNIFMRAEASIKRYHWYDISLVKLSTAAAVLLIAKLWPPLLSLDWYWYVLVAIVAAIRPLALFFSSK